MNYSPIFAAAARIEAAYTTAQSFIANECPVLEQRLKRGVLELAVIAIEVAIALIDFTVDQIERLPEYHLQVQIAWLNAKRFAVRQLIKAAQLNERYQVTATARNVWSQKGRIVRTVGDKVFSLN